MSRARSTFKVFDCVLGTRDAATSENTYSQSRASKAAHLCAVSRTSFAHKPSFVVACAVPHLVVSALTSWLMSTFAVPFDSLKTLSSSVQANPSADSSTMARQVTLIRSSGTTVPGMDAMVLRWWSWEMLRFRPKRPPIFF